jgi:O-antigen/teichoic acid export membrane protein
LTNSYFHYPKRYVWIWRQIYGFLIIWMPIFGIFNGLFVYIIVPSSAAENSLLISVLFSIPMFVFGPISKLGEIKYQLDGDVKAIVIRAGISGLIGVIVNIYLIKYLNMGYMGWVWSNFIVTILLNASYWYPLVLKEGFKPIVRFRRKTILFALKVGIPTIPHKYSMFIIASSDRIVLERLSVPIAQIGGYNLANSFGAYFEQIANGLEKALSPVLYRNMKEGNAEFRVVINSFIFLLILAFLYGVWAKEIFGLLVKNRDLFVYYKLSIVLAFSYTYRPFYSAFSAKVLYDAKTKYLWLFTFSIGLINIITNLIFVPILGFEVVAFSTLLCNILFGFFGHGIKHFGSYGIFPLRTLILSIFSILVLLYISMLMVDCQFIVKLFTTLVVCTYVFFAYAKDVKK